MNGSVMLALFSLLVFALSSKKYLKPFQPLLKFTALKLIIFLTFWQYIAISVLVALNVIRGDEEKTQGEIATDLQDWLMCVEVLPFAFLMFLAYPVNLVKGIDKDDELGAPVDGAKGGAALELSSSKEIKTAAAAGPEVVKKRRGQVGQSRSGFFVNIRHALAVNDVIDDTRTYTDYQYGDFTSLGREGDNMEEDEEEGAGGYDAYFSGGAGADEGGSGTGGGRRASEGDSDHAKEGTTGDTRGSNDEPAGSSDHLQSTS